MIVASDVDNPLLGPNGAAAIYGPQKGADPDDVALLDAALAHWADVLDAATGTALRDRPGAGAAGGVGYGALAALGAELKPGIDLVLELVGFAEALPGRPAGGHRRGFAGRADTARQGPGRGGRGRRRRGRPGGDRLRPAGPGDRSSCAAAGIRQAYALTDIEPDLARCLAEPGPLLEQLARKLAEDWLSGSTVEDEK